MMFPSLARAVAFCVVLLACTMARADSIYGRCVHKDGSKAGSHVRISTSWNSKTTSPAAGRYTLDFGVPVKKRITVYCNGTTVGTVYVDGSTRFDIVVP